MAAKERAKDQPDTASQAAESSATLAGATWGDGEGVGSELIHAEPEPSPRIIEASASFDFDEVSDWGVPSTIPGAREETEIPSAPQCPPSLAPGQRVGRYLTEEILGQGGMGLVLRARDDLLQRTVAIKVILPQYFSADASAGLRFLREAEIVARLDHPNIIRVLDAGLDSGVAFLAFEYVEGKTFSAIRDEGAPKSATEAVDLLLPVMSAVARAHELGVVHGDLKPTNLLLGKDHAGRPHPWVLDFGVSFFSNIEAGLDPMRNKVSGTPGYLAPEWLTGSGVDGRADCFSLGCVLYELLAQKAPFAGVTRLSEAATAATMRAYPALSTVSKADLALERVVNRALEPDPRTRFDDLKSMARALLPFASASCRSYYASEFNP